jgi:hypothetical protein
MIGSDADVRGAAFDQRQHRVQDAANRGDLVSLRVLSSRDGEKMPEEFVSSIDKVDFHTK